MANEMATIPKAKVVSIERKSFFGAIIAFLKNLFVRQAKPNAKKAAREADEAAREAERIARDREAKKLYAKSLLKSLKIEHALNILNEINEKVSDEELRARAEEILQRNSEIMPDTEKLRRLNGAVSAFVILKDKEKLQACADIYAANGWNDSGLECCKKIVAIKD